MTIFESNLLAFLPTPDRLTLKSWLFKNQKFYHNFYFFLLRISFPRQPCQLLRRLSHISYIFTMVEKNVGFQLPEIRASLLQNIFTMVEENFGYNCLKCSNIKKDWASLLQNICTMVDLSYCLVPPVPAVPTFCSPNRGTHLQTRILWILTETNLR